MALEVLQVAGFPWGRPYPGLHDRLIGTWVDPELIGRCADPPVLPAEPDEDEAAA